MSGIYHSWNGTVLTITSDSGTSSADLAGAKGDTGIRGPQGVGGVAGLQGPQGPQGEPGPAGPAGPAGPKGEDGKMTFSDLTAEQKASLKGDKGDQGDPGPAGDPGPQGEQGPQGVAGPQGPKGEQGPKGDTGETGPQGPQGEPGPQGEKGEKGDPGDGGLDYSAISDVWNASKLFVVGDYVILDNTLWKCILDNNGQQPSAESIYWTKCSVTSELNAINDVRTDTEQWTGKFFDGKKVYRKYLPTGALPNAETKFLSTGYTGAAINILQMSGIARYANGITLPIPNFSAEPLENIKIVVNDIGQIALQTFNNRSGATGYLFIEYTKN